ncbi:alpha/beta fold hydrolase [Actinoplanes sp. CA-015351]|uniref:alpha/beta fold hydrolase n=1 Tax=Actinoplanes sp. CA-015351 TaxID=3239897 RepID=UPI003D9A0237
MKPRRYPVPAPVTEGDLTIWRDAVVGEVSGFRPLMLDVFRPAGDDKRPLIVWIHGGAWRKGSNKGEAVAQVPDHLVKAGYAVARVTYRLSGEARFPAQLHDVKAAVRWLRQHATELGVDPARFGVWGESAGGHLAAMVALTGKDPELAGDVGVSGPSDSVAAAVVWYGPSNLLSMASQNHPDGLQDHDDPESPESRLIGGPVQELPKEAAAASPVTYVTESAPPILLVHGDEDRIVPVGQSIELQQRLAEAGTQVELRIVAGADHCLIGADLGPEVSASIAHLDGVLKKS